MSTRGGEIASAAETLIGTRFRLHGRNPETGLDCIGLVGQALESCGRLVHYPQGYKLRNIDIARWLEFAGANGLRDCAGPAERGHILLTQPGPAQHHLLIALGGGQFVHAHAGLRRVVSQRISLIRPPLAQWRFEPDREQSWPL
ncbi:MAG: C40 family peptidase [Erythrobacter sp.]|uniref:NlpC/P60 family protein n=1 Tax=Erythrobacter sp. TaxID=1042 RepID=UPI001B18D896|nr:NlpC/P60 family protein [Erythrobacter sp.]MBO6767072.1 C40 family peptidase [Erythrobacter sp.]